MNRIATRAWIVLLLVLAFGGGLIFFYGEYFAGAEDWVVFSGSPHVYSGSKLASGVITDSEGTVLLDMSEDWTYAENATVRKSLLHWVGDRLGNISVPMLGTYRREMVGYDPIGGVYAYGGAAAKLRLTLNAQVQAAALSAMGDYHGTVAVYNYKTGELLCAVTAPNYDPDNVPDIAGDTTGSYEGVYLNRFTQSVYIPGSIFKIVTLAAALETVPDIREQSFRCSGKYMAGNGDITCAYAHGTQNLQEAFANSCNCAFAQIVEKIGPEKLQWYVELFGVMDSITFDGITTARGNFDITDASQEELAWSGIGQHKDQVNPCAFLVFMGAIANDGVGVTPYVVSDITIAGKTTYEAKTQDQGRILSVSAAQELQTLMAGNVTIKYGEENFPGLTVCAKSGTAEVGGSKKPNAMFAGFLRDPEYPFAFLVAIEDGGYGSEVCIPILRQVLDACKEVQ